MPEKTFTVATYAAGASLAAITLVYVFGPTYFLDNNPTGGHSTRKRGAIGLANPANDCFINSVLQALAGLGDLRLYLIREIYRRSLDEGWVYARAIPAGSRVAVGDTTGDTPDWKLEGLQSGIITSALKDILDSLNERPIYKKTITAGSFVRSLEIAFRQRISRQQQDAQEFLQVVAERLSDEYHAGQRARFYARSKSKMTLPISDDHASDDPRSDAVGGRSGAGAVSPGSATASPADPASDPAGSPRSVPSASQEAPHVDEWQQDAAEEGFPMEGKFESQIECLTCGFKPKPTESTFCTLTLHVPQASSTSLGACFDGMFKTEYIDDFKCEKCRLLHAVGAFEAELRSTNSGSFREEARVAIAKLQAAIETDPENPPKDVVLPNVRYAPKRRIARHTRLTSFPKIMAVHLSRSIYDASHLSQKNSAKVSFPERLPLGGLLQQRTYNLLALVTHKGSHHSGHYESFRRHKFYPPFSNPSTFQPSGMYSSSASPASTPHLGASQRKLGDSSPLASTPDLPSSFSTTGSSTPSLELPAVSGAAPRSPQPSAEAPTRPPRPSPAPAPRERDAETGSLRSVAASARSTLSRIASLPSSRSGSNHGSGQGTPTLAPGGPGSSTAPAPAPAPPHKRQPGSSKPKRRRHSDRWWRISDEKIKEASTRDVLGMQREVYLLFYEVEREPL